MGGNDVCGGGVVVCVRKRESQESKTHFIGERDTILRT